MARDRLAAMRANQPSSLAHQPAAPSFPSHPQHHNSNHAYQAPGSASAHSDEQHSPKDNGHVDSYEMQEKYFDMATFMDEVSALNDGIKSVNDSVDRIRDHHSRLLSELDEAQHQAIASQLASLTADTSRLTRNLKSRIASLQTAAAHGPPGGDSNVRRTQVGALKKRFMDAIMRYQSVEQESRQKYKARMERQYRIVKPDATPDEIRQAVDSDDGGQVFSQALMTSNRYGDARAAFNEVKERHQDVRRIEQTLTELMQMFNDLATMVEEQDQLVQNVETTAAEVNRDTEEAGKHITKARNSAAAARRKRWICFFILVLILLIVGAIVAIVIVTNNNKNNNNNNNNKT